MCDLKRNLGAWLREQRKAHGFTQQTLSFESGVSIPAISKIERGLSSPNSVTIQKLQDAMGAQDVLGISGAPASSGDSLEKVTQERDALRQQINDIRKIVGGM